MKKRCYPKYSYLFFMVFSVIFFICSIAPLFIETNDVIIVKVFWSFTMAVLCLICIMASIHNLQYFYVEGDHIVVKSAFGTIMKMNFNNVMVNVESLPTYYSWSLSVDKKWICIYDKNSLNEGLSKFKSGCSNNKRYNRIQIIYSKENKKTIDQWINNNINKA